MSESVRLIKPGQRVKLGKIIGKKEVNIPDMVGTQINSYNSFLYDSSDRLSAMRKMFGHVFPIQTENAKLEFIEYSINKPVYEESECFEKKLTYSTQIRASLRLTTWGEVLENGTKPIKSVVEEGSLLVTDFPAMTQRGTFIINGSEYVVVSQIHRCPGLFLDRMRNKLQGRDKFLYSARIIPYYGSWIDFELDYKEHLFFRIDKKRKILATVLLRAMGADNGQIMKHFYRSLTLTNLGQDKWDFEFTPSLFADLKLPFKLQKPEGQLVSVTGVKINKKVMRNLDSHAGSKFVLSGDDLLGLHVSSSVIDEKGTVLITAGTALNGTTITKIAKSGIKSLHIALIDGDYCGPYVVNTLLSDKTTTPEEAMFEIARVMRSGENITRDSAINYFHSLLSDPARYDLSEVGRMKLNTRLGLSLPESYTLITIDDVFGALDKLVKMRDGHIEPDDVDHLSNRRVRAVGELIGNQFLSGLAKVKKSTLDFMSSVDLSGMVPREIINFRVLSSLMRNFFATSPLSQFMDQTNPLSGISHTRRLSALGPGGLNRDRAGFEVRDVHYTHYGRICPAETPEGTTIGLISSMATYARINKYGFIETPYREVVDNVASDKIVYLSATQEEGKAIAQADAVDQSGKFISSMVYCRIGEELIAVPVSEVKYVEVSPKQLVSVAAALIPFIENTDANRTLMGANMQKQAVPLLISSAPLVATGLEAEVVRDSRSMVIAKRGGRVEYVDLSRIVVFIESAIYPQSSYDVYDLITVRRSNNSTLIKQRPAVKVGDVIQAGHILANGASTDEGELALGKNALVGFISAGGLNFEDSVLISEGLLQRDIYTSVHIEELECAARDVKLGPEYITRNIPGLNDDLLANIDESGVIMVGAEVQPGCIIVCKATPKTEAVLTSEERLCRLVFGQPQGADSQDSSLRAGPSTYGTVIDVKWSVKRGLEKDLRLQLLEEMEINQIKWDYDNRISIVRRCSLDLIKRSLEGSVLKNSVANISAGTTLKHEDIENISDDLIFSIVSQDESINTKISSIKSQLDALLKEREWAITNHINKIIAGVDLPSGTLKVVRVYIATKMKMQAGDKVSGRYGNKGVVSKVVPIQDMPYLEDGTPLEIALSPFGIPSRMNIGQILETHLGFAVVAIGKKLAKMATLKEDNWVQQARQLLQVVYKDDSHYDRIALLSEQELEELCLSYRQGVPVAVPVFESPSDERLSEVLQAGDLDSSGQVHLWDGLTGERYDRKVTVGYMYMLKLHHLVDNKMHARSVGPYSLVTQQPLGGKAQFGGQRFGEMEVWATEAYGAAYTLQEMLTVKSDDVNGRVRMYEAIVRGDAAFQCGFPESFNVMIRELRALGLDVIFRNGADISEPTFSDIVPDEVLA